MRNGNLRVARKGDVVTIGADTETHYILVHVLPHLEGDVYLFIKESDLDNEFDKGSKFMSIDSLVETAYKVTIPEGENCSGIIKLVPGARSYKITMFQSFSIAPDD